MSKHIMKGGIYGIKYLFNPMSLLPLTGHKPVKDTEERKSYATEPLLRKDYMDKKTNVELRCAMAH